MFHPKPLYKLPVNRRSSNLTDCYRVVRSVSDLSPNKARDSYELHTQVEKERLKALEEKRNLRKRLSLEALGEERRLKNEAKRERRRRRKLNQMDSSVQVEEKEIKKKFRKRKKNPKPDIIPRLDCDKTDSQIFEDQTMTLSQRAKIYKEHEQKKEMMNMAIDSYCEKLKTKDGRPIRVILIDDSKCFNQKPENENFEEMLKKRIKEDRAQLDDVLIELKQKVEQDNYQKKLLKEQKKIQKEKMKDKKLMIKLLKERIKQENRSMDKMGKKNLLLTMKEQQTLDKPIETNMLLSGSNYILNNNIVKDMLLKIISKGTKRPKEESSDESTRDKDIEEIGDQMEEECFRKMLKERKRKEGKINRKKMKNVLPPSSPHKAEIALMAPKKARKVNEKIVELWRDMIKKHSNRHPSGFMDVKQTEQMEEINLKESSTDTEGKQIKKEKSFKKKLRLPLKFHKDCRLLKNLGLHPLSIIN